MRLDCRSLNKDLVYVTFWVLFGELLIKSGVVSWVLTTEFQIVVLLSVDACPEERCCSLRGLRLGFYWASNLLFQMSLSLEGLGALQIGDCGAGAGACVKNYLRHFSFVVWGICLLGDLGALIFLFFVLRNYFSSILLYILSCSLGDCTMIRGTTLLGANLWHQGLYKVGGCSCTDYEVGVFVRFLL